MAEMELKASQEVEALQADFAGWLDRAHQLAAETFPNGDRTIAKTRGDWNRQTADALGGEVFKFSSIYGAVPEGYHLRVGLVPTVFYMLSARAGDLTSLFNTVHGKIGNSYVVEVARRREMEELNPGQKVINMKPLGSGNYPERYGIELERVSSDRGRERISARFFPEDILSLEIVADKTL